MSIVTEEKKRQAYSMHVRGITTAEIASSMRRTENTVRGWIKSCSEDVRDRLKAINQEDYVGLMLARFQALREEAWANYHSAQKKADRNRFWKSILDVEKTEVATLMKMGYVKSSPEQHEHTVEHKVSTDAFMQANLNVARLDAFSVDLLAGRLDIDANVIMDMIPKTRDFHSLPIPEDRDARESLASIEKWVDEDPDPEPVEDQEVPDLTQQSQEDDEDV